MIEKPIKNEIMFIKEFNLTNHTLATFSSVAIFNRNISMRASININKIQAKKICNHSAYLQGTEYKYGNYKKNAQNIETLNIKNMTNLQSIETQGKNI